MDDWASTDGSSRLRTTGVADCLVMLLHSSNKRAGALAHMSFPKAVSAQISGDPPLKVRTHVSGIRDAMLKAISDTSGNIDVVLWRGLGFSSDFRVIEYSGNILDELTWDHFGKVYDYMWHGEDEALPYKDCTAVTYDSQQQQLWFHN